MAGAGNHEVARCDGGDISWQAQYFVRVRLVDAESFVAGAENGEVVSCGGGECRCDIGILACERVLFGGAGIAKLQDCLMCVLRWVFPLDSWRKSHTKRLFCRRHVSF